MNNDKIKEIVFWGATGQAKVLREITDYLKLKLIALFDNNKNVQPPFADVPLYYGKKEFETWLKNRDSANKTGFLIAIGGDRGKDRLILQEYLEEKGLVALTVIHPSAVIAENVKVGTGSQILANTTVSVETIIGRGCIVNTGAIIDHECHIHDGSHICPGAHLAGCVNIGRYVMVGTGAIILPRITVGEGAIIGAGSVVVKDVTPNTVVWGNPARKERNL